MQSSSPLVSILLPAYNAGDYLNASIDSVLSQSYTNIELIVIDDCSTDNTKAIISSYSDPRIKPVFHSQNQGLPNTLNSAFTLANGKYIARMDADDISLPDRIAKQVAFLESHPDYSLLGSLYANMDQDSKVYEIGAQLLHHEEISIGIMFVNSFCHGSVMFRKTFLVENKILYDLKYVPYEDYELWTRLVKLTKVANLPEVLYLYMTNPAGMFLTRHKEMIQGPKSLGKKLVSQTKLPQINLSYLKYLYSRSKLYRVPKLKVQDKLYASNLTLAYQTYLYKLGLAYCSKKNFAGLSILALSFFLSPLNWLKKLLGFIK